MNASSREAASAVTAYLTAKSYGGSSPLEALVEAHITAIAREVAREIVESTPQLRETIESLTRQTVNRALQQDDGLRRGVVRAVAEALTTRHDEDQD